MGEKAVRPEKGYAVEQIGKMIGESSSLIVTTFTGLGSARMNTLRSTVRKKSGRYFVVKNRTFGVAARQFGLEGLCAFLKGQIGIVFGQDDSLDLLKAVVNFGRENEELKLLGGFFEGRVRSAEDMLAVAVMPPREICAGELVGTLSSPLSELVEALSGVARSFVFVLNSVAENRGRSVPE